jgi:DNA-binding Lrp family transcriptional regulator
MDAIDEQILALLTENARRSYQDIARHVSLSLSAVKRRVDALRASGVLLGFTTVVNYEAQGWAIEALVLLYLRHDALLHKQEWMVSLRRHPSVIDAWLVVGDWDAIVHVVAEDGDDLERLLLDLRSDGFIERTKTVIVLSPLVPHRTLPQRPAEALPAMEEGAGSTADTAS